MQTLISEFTVDIYWNENIRFKIYNHDNSHKYHIEMEFIQDYNLKQTSITSDMKGR